MRALAGAPGSPAFQLVAHQLADMCRALAGGSQCWGRMAGPNLAHDEWTQAFRNRLYQKTYP